ncbi:FAD-dependent oxidoreductase [Gordonia oryzae]|uniref:FAD-dependent oxidoreductase n=1 Tax=Gordonia oryzae TaxID=2487349 RepID=UPI001FE580CE|nr:FAD-dependent oxidoreductase [Gordonia oryzae]
MVTDWESATRLRNRLAELRGVGRVTVGGGGLTGIETAAELAEAGHRVTLVTADEIASNLSVRGRERTRRALDALGVVCHEHTRVERIGATAVTLVHATGEMQVGEIEVNGLPGFTVAVSDDPGVILWLDVVDGLIRHVFVMRNPAKMAAVRTVREISRH